MATARYDQAWSLVSNIMTGYEVLRGYIDPQPLKNARRGPSVFRGAFSNALPNILAGALDVETKWEIFDSISSPVPWVMSGYNGTKKDSRLWTCYKINQGVIIPEDCQKFCIIEL